LLLYSSKPSLGVFQLAGHFYFINKRQQAFWHHHHRAINKFSGAIAGDGNLRRRNSYINYIPPPPVNLAP
jgi:hypothetical protein